MTTNRIAAVWVSLILIATLAEDARALADGEILVLEPDRILRVDPVSGNRTVLSGCEDLPACATLVGTGPLLDSNSGDLVVEASGAIVVGTNVDALNSMALIRVDPETGNRSIVSGGGVGTGPTLGGVGGSSNLGGMTVVSIPPATVSSLGPFGLVVVGLCIGLLMRRNAQR